MRYVTANDHFRAKYGMKLYKAAVSLDVTCPNRDGKCGTGGCIFCSAGGSGEFAGEAGRPVREQLEGAIELLSRKTGPDTGFIAYFQSFTSTYCEPEYLRAALEEARSHPRVKAIAVATRPDCLPPEIMKVLSDINRTIPLTVELGLQTSNDETAIRINRGYKTCVYREACRELKRNGIEVVTHIIFALPGESTEDMMNTVRYAVDSGTDGVKFTCLYVLKGTVLEKQYLAGEFALPEMEEYFDIVEQALDLLPEGTVVHRLTGDGPKKYLIAPMWTANKRGVVNYINRRFG